MSRPEVVAIGDVHGCASLLEQELTPHLDTGAELIFLGDLIDRSPEADGDQRVLERVWQLQENPGAYGLAAVTVLRGNHEQMLLKAMAPRAPGEDVALWLCNGANPDLLPLARERQAWFDQLPYTAIRGRYLFVHAGVRPDIRLEHQATDDLIWIRRPFLSRPHGLPYTVVHGHTFRLDFKVTRLPHRIGIDTGAYLSGVLTALKLEIPSPHSQNMDTSS
jgi:serine/threonine protein phosphatase 1